MTVFTFCFRFASLFSPLRFPFDFIFIFARARTFHLHSRALFTLFSRKDSLLSWPGRWCRARCALQSIFIYYVCIGIFQTTASRIRRTGQAPHVGSLEVSRCMERICARSCPKHIFIYLLLTFININSRAFVWYEMHITTTHRPSPCGLLSIQLNWLRLLSLVYC